jgi:hypothetical protein
MVCLRQSQTVVQASADASLEGGRLCERQSVLLIEDDLAI